MITLIFFVFILNCLRCECYMCAHQQCRCFTRLKFIDCTMNKLKAVPRFRNDANYNQLSLRGNPQNINFIAIVQDLPALSVIDLGTTGISCNTLCSPPNGNCDCVLVWLPSNNDDMQQQQQQGQEDLLGLARDQHETQNILYLLPNSCPPQARCLPQHRLHPHVHLQIASVSSYYQSSPRGPGGIATECHQ